MWRVRARVPNEWGILSVLSVLKWNQTRLLIWNFEQERGEKWQVSEKDHKNTRDTQTMYDKTAYSITSKKFAQARS